MPTITSPPKKPRSIVFRAFVLSSIGLIVVGLQIALPLISYRSSGKRIDNGLPSDPRREMTFWDRRRCFEAFVDPHPTYRWDLDFASATVCQDEIVVLWSRDAHMKGTPREADRMNLRTGQVTIARAPADADLVLSDGNALWWFGFRDYSAFMFEGRPARLVMSYSDRGATVRLDQFEDGNWQSTDRFAFWPAGELQVQLDRTSGRMWGFTEYGPGVVWFINGITFESAAEHRDRLAASPVAARDPRYTLDEARLKQLGMKPFLNWSGHGAKVGRWAAANTVSVLTKVFHDDTKALGITWHRFSEDEVFEPVFVALPLRFQRHDRAIGVRLVEAANGDKFILSRSKHDGRWTVFRWDNGTLHRIFNQRSPLLGIACLDAATLYGLICVIPTMFLGIAAWFAQWRNTNHLSFADETVELASVTRRGIARGIDLACVMPLILVAVILHPAVLDWWLLVVEDWSKFSDPFRQLTKLDWQRCVASRSWGSKLVSTILTAPLNWSPYAAAIVIAIGQTIWQARTGQTLGKWLIGIRVRRTTLRPCGFARSLLRESFLMIDSVFFLSWVPGVISILATQNSQRIGDLLSDTIVIRDVSTTTISTIDSSLQR